ncbi:phosphotransferase enzyme family protein [Deinococcus maricopensis]|uniref:Aminoglycoside phosphotransferase n=1 Tax=Deinococcus maricopensis (strain DSM 21211 / LMG 22137 / NRRL B-23946 / LB-34) TaxID=709986 RepID=E8U5C6_DEIML|nr:phosphotransferase [Deinococcus maricopensis]ADV66265.1 aminoglycoside phosphotransferase [Deinococcus maricopensis DSM 21211]
MTHDALITAALHPYGLSGAPFTVLRTLGNVVARVDTPDGPRGLRVCRSSVTRERLHEEFRVLAAARAAGLDVPEPLPDVTGDPLPRAQGRDVALFRWVPGEGAGAHMSEAVAAQLGTLSAHLHAALRALGQPHPWYGPTHDAAWLSGPASWWATRADRDLGAHACARMAPAIAACAQHLAHHAAEMQVIHADLHFGNALVRADGTVAAIDFDMCAVGLPAFDLAVTEGEFEDFDHPDALKAAFRGAYAAASGAPYPQGVALMRVAASVAFLEWVFTSANDEVRTQKLRWVPRLIDRVAARAPGARQGGPTGSAGPRP